MNRAECIRVFTRWQRKIGNLMENLRQFEAHPRGPKRGTQGLAGYWEFYDWLGSFDIVHIEGLAYYGDLENEEVQSLFRRLSKDLKGLWELDCFIRDTMNQFQKDEPLELVPTLN